MMKLNYFEDINQYYEEVKPYLIQQQWLCQFLCGGIESNVA
ncbi:MAG: hypothetical protein WBG73_04375 [Coleofasciculaceae cyanobacterium]